MPDKLITKLEDVECSVLNEDWIRKNQGVMKGMGANPAELRSPGLKVQVLRRGLPGLGRHDIYCENFNLGNHSCELNQKSCILFY